MAKEKRLIDANAMRDDWLENGENEYVYDTNAVLESIDAQPTVDAVEVVRCKDCRHWREGYGMQGTCQHFDDETDDDSFCSYGERKDNG